MQKLIEYPNISIIIPIYKAEKYIERCINSILGQTYKNFELILVNDGSPDHSLVICNRFADSDKRIKVINQENKGAHAARLQGFLKSVAPFITFVDADDYLPLDALITLYDEITKGYDIVKGKVLSKEIIDAIYEKEEISGCTFMERIYISTLEAYLCGAIYKRDLFNEEIFNICINNKLLIGEDWITNLYIGRKANKILIIDKGCYFYYKNTDSIMNSTFMSDSYSRQIERVANQIIDLNDPHWVYLSQLKAAACIANLFVVERKYNHLQYLKTKSFIEKYGIETLSPYVDYRYLKYIKYEPIYRLYTWCYKKAKFIFKQKRHMRKMNIL